MPDGGSYSLWLKGERCEVNGRFIPLNTKEWHDYRLESQDGKFARLIIDGEVVSARIEPQKTGRYKNRGVYCMASDGTGESKAEMEYIKIK
jgi:hypothetical protein